MGTEENPDRLRVLIRHGNQDYETRELEDPRKQYVENYNDLHSDDPFWATLPEDEMQSNGQGKFEPPRKRNRWPVVVLWFAVVFVLVVFVWRILARII